MIRHAAAAALAMCLSPSWLCAQSTVLTVNASPAKVYKSPSTGSPVIGYAPRGAVLEVTRELGSWVKVSWSGAEDGVGYVHVTMGSLGRRSQPEPSGTAVSRSQPPAPPTAAPAPAAVRAERIEPAARPALTRPVYVTPSSHLVGLGGRVGGSTLGFGASARGWRRDRFGMQLEVSRYAVTNPAAAGRVSSIQFEPSLLYSLTDRVTDYVWVRPYLGSGFNVRRQTFSGVTPDAGNPASNTTLGLQAFGGAELTSASVPRLALSVDLGYHWAGTPFAGVELGGFGVSVAGHWYAK